METKTAVELKSSITTRAVIYYFISILLTAAVFVNRSNALSVAAVFAAGLIALYLVKEVALRSTFSKHLLFSYLILIGGTVLFYIIFGVGPLLRGMITSILPALPAMAVCLLMLYLNRLVKPKLQRIASLGLALALALFSLQYLYTMNLSIRPRVDSLKEGRDSYLASLKGPAEGPNVLLIFMDDLGYGDLSLYGNEIINTPNLELLAENGVVMDNFYAASPVCTPSRFAVLTGRYPVRGHLDNVLFPSVKPGIFRFWNVFFLDNGVEGLLPDEITKADALKAAGYTTGIFGKWHLGDYGDYLPNNSGFDHFYGSYYSNDMHPYEFYRNEDKVIEHPLDQRKITRNLTDEIINFIEENKESRFFAYYASPWPHFPIYASERFAGTSKAGSYGDCMQEFDAGLGEILQALEEHGLLEETLIIFTSDNGPWHEGSAGALRGRKGNSLDGGQKVPFIAVYPGVLPAGTRVSAPAMTIDLFPTILALCGLDLPRDRIIDGINILPLLQGDADAPQHEALFFSKGGKIKGIRRDGFKYFSSVGSENAAYLHAAYKDFLFDLDSDPAESYNVRDLYPDTAAELRQRLQDFNRQIKENPRGKL